MTNFVYLYMALLVTIGLFLAFTLSYFWVKVVNWLFREPKEKSINNPYIKAQILKDKNDRDYEEYLKWMEKNSSGVPFQKILSREDFEAEKKIKKLL